jgi:hypothetical protein
MYVTLTPDFFQITYDSVGAVQLTFLRLLSEEAHQVRTLIIPGKVFKTWSKHLSTYIVA